VFFGAYRMGAIPNGPFCDVLETPSQKIENYRFFFLHILKAVVGKINQFIFKVFKK
jgi:hypothetical protein